jgi:hypothetical protein
MPCGNYMVTVIPYNIDTTWTNLTIRGEGYGCVNMWFSQDFTTDGSGGGQIIRFTPTLGNLEEITVDGLGNAPAAIANKRLVGMGSEGGIRNFRVQNWEPPTGFNNTCLVTTSDRLVAYHPIVSCNSIGAWQIQSLGTDIYDPEISGGEFGINFTEQGGRMFGGRVNAGNQATHAVMTSTCCGPSVNDIFIFGTHVACSSVTCFGFDLTASGNTLHLIGVDCAIFQNQSNIANMGCVKTAAGSTAYISNSILYARSTSTIFNNSGTIIDAGGNTISADSNGAFYTGAGVYVGVSTTNNCAAVGTAASPSVAACGSAAAGSFSCATNATGATCQINTTAVTANSVIMVEENDTTAQGTKLGVTCNTSTTVNPATRLIASQTAGTGFVINLGTVTTNPACFNYTIVN